MEKPNEWITVEAVDGWGVERYPLCLHVAQIASIAPVNKPWIIEVNGGRAGTLVRMADGKEYFVLAAYKDFLAWLGAEE